jgi:hypothetical protein
MEREVKKVLVIGSLLLLSGCVSAEEEAAHRYANINRSCDKMGYTTQAEHANCVQSLAIMTQQMRQERADRAEAAGQAMQQAGAALQSIR